MTKFRTLFCTAAALALAAPSLAAAQGLSVNPVIPSTIPYLAFGGGVNITNDPTLTYLSDNSVNGPYTNSISKLSGFDPGTAFYAAFGLDFRNGWRSEVEASFHFNKGARFNIQNEGSAAISIDKSSFTILANLWHDFTLTDQVAMHVGGGLGVGNVGKTITSNAPGLPAVTSSVSGTGLAYMLGTGFDFSVPGASRIKITLDYRLTGIDVGSNNVNVPYWSQLGSNAYDRTAVVGVGGLNLDHSVMVGLRIPLMP